MLHSVLGKTESASERTVEHAQVIHSEMTGFHFSLLFPSCSVHVVLLFIAFSLDCVSNFMKYTSSMKNISIEKNIQSWIYFTRRCFTQRTTTFVLMFGAYCLFVRSKLFRCKMVIAFVAQCVYNCIFSI